MGLPYTFAGLSQWNSSWLDADFNAVGACVIAPCTVSGTNTLVLTPAANTPAPTYANYRAYAGIAANSNSGATTANIGGLGALNVYKDTGSGPTALAGGEIIKNAYIELVYDGTLNTGAGGFHLLTSPATATGTVTSITAGTGLSGGAITTSGTIALAAIADQRLFANISGGSAAPAAATLTAVLDAVLSATQGALLARGASTWAAVTEASWSPAVAFGGSSTGITYGTQVGQSYAMGFLTLAMFSIVLTSKGAQTGGATLSLPAASGGGGRVGSVILSNYANLGAVATVPWGQIGAASATAQLVKAGTATVANLTDADFANNTSIAGFAIYLTG